MAAPKGKVLQVVDGDTVDVVFRVRLAGVDCPEMKTEEGKVALARTKELLPPGAKVSVFHVLGETNYGRLIARIEDVGGRDIGEILVSEGLARTIFPRPTLQSGDPRISIPSGSVDHS